MSVSALVSDSLAQVTHRSCLRQGGDEPSGHRTVPSAVLGRSPLVRVRGSAFGRRAVRLRPPVRLVTRSPGGRVRRQAGSVLCRRAVPPLPQGGHAPGVGGGAAGAWRVHGAGRREGRARGRGAGARGPGPGWGLDRPGPSEPSRGSRRPGPPRLVGFPALPGPRSRPSPAVGGLPLPSRRSCSAPGACGAVAGCCKAAAGSQRVRRVRRVRSGPRWPAAGYASIRFAERRRWKLRASSRETCIWETPSSALICDWVRLL